MTRSRIWAVAPAIFALAGCQQPSSTADTGKIAEQLKQSEAKWNAAYAAHDATALANAYADDAALANPGAPLITGGSDIRKQTTAFASDPNLRVQFASDRIQVAQSGDLAYTRGRYTLTMTDPATKKPANSAGNYLTVWQKQRDGSWKAVEDFITPGPDMAK